MSIEELRAFFDDAEGRWPLTALEEARRKLEELAAALDGAVTGTGRDEPRNAVVALRAAEAAVRLAMGACRSADRISQTYAEDL